MGLGFTFAAYWRWRERPWDGLLARPCCAWSAAAEFLGLLVSAGRAILVLLGHGRGGVRVVKGVGYWRPRRPRAAAGLCAVASLEALLHLADAGLELFELGGLSVDLLLSATWACPGQLERSLCCHGRRGGEELRKGMPATDRLSICSSRSATLFSMRKMSISSAEKDRAIVLWQRSSVSHCLAAIACCSGLARN